MAILPIRIARCSLAAFGHGHYDGAKEWDYPTVKGNSAAMRRKCLGNPPQFISHVCSIEGTRHYFREANVVGNLTFQVIPYRKHTDTWVQFDIPERQVLCDWVAEVLESSVPSE